LEARLESLAGLGPPSAMRSSSFFALPLGTHKLREELLREAAALQSKVHVTSPWPIPMADLADDPLSSASRGPVLANMPLWEPLGRRLEFPHAAFEAIPVSAPSKEGGRGAPLRPPGPSPSTFPSPLASTLAAVPLNSSGLTNCTSIHPADIYVPAWKAAEGKHLDETKTGVKLRKGSYSSQSTTQIPVLRHQSPGCRTSPVPSPRCRSPQLHHPPPPSYASVVPASRNATIQPRSQVPGPGSSRTMSPSAPRAVSPIPSRSRSPLATRPNSASACHQDSGFKSRTLHSEHRKPLEDISNYRMHS
jgi:hypothetical protein